MVTPHELSTSSVTLVVSALIAVVIIGYVVRIPGSKYASLPPGPARSPFGGTPMPREYPWRHFYELSKTYGPVVTVWNGTRPEIVCNDVQSAEFFLEKHARDSADRPRQLVADEIFSHNKRTLLVGYGERWRRLRKALHHVTQPKVARELRKYQEDTARTVVANIINEPERFQQHIQTYAATLVVHMAYGRSDEASYSDPDIKSVVVGSKRLGILLVNKYLVESVPILRYVPGYLSTVNQWADDELALYRGSFRDVKRRISAKQSVEPCFATYLLEHQEELGLSDDEVAYLLGSVFGAGSDTSSSAITIIVMAAATHPEQQERVQAELDRVLGTETPPSFADLEIEDVPVLHAFIAESFRWRPVSSGGFRHRTTADVAYQGYVIPAGTTISGNHWGIHRDEKYYGPDVESFNMDRWLDDEGRFKRDMKHYQFGFGRRICPGLHVATNSVLINAALLLWSFDVQRNVRDGKLVEIDTLAFSNTANSHPEPFEAQFTARQKGLKALFERP